LTRQKSNQIQIKSEQEIGKRGQHTHNHTHSMVVAMSGSLKCIQVRGVANYPWQSFLVRISF